jgi:CHAD domain-containing protein
MQEQSVEAMGFRFHRDESVPTGIRRMVVEQIDRAMDRLAPDAHNQEDAVHDARKCFKKIRAVLRLVRDEIDDEVYKSENIFFRDVGRRLSDVRNATIIIQAFDGLVKRSSDMERYRLLRTSIVASHDEAVDRLRKRWEDLGELRELLHEAKDRVAGWPLERDRFAAMGRGLRRTYRHGRSAYAEVVAEASVEHLHEWRKEVKHLWYQLRMLRSVWPEVMGPLVRELEALSEELGEDHDLALLSQALLSGEEFSSHSDIAAALAALGEKRREALQESAKSRGARLYAEKPKPFVTRIRGYWDVWRETADVDREER